ncbi:MAG: hypothetical protein KBT40_04630 [bacterium]|nr:hypothetical protein [Candidatus Minthenecus merdequi]
MKTTKKLLVVCTFVLLTVSVNCQTVVRSLDNGNNPNIPKKEKDEQQTNNQDQINPNKYVVQETKTNQNNNINDLSFFGIGAGYVYEFGSGKSDDGLVEADPGKGMHGFRIPIYFNYVFKKTHVGIYGLAGYECNIHNEKYVKTTVHRVPILLHASLNFGSSNNFGIFLHGGPGLNILAGGKQEIGTGNKKETKSVESKCDFTMGAGLGFVIKKVILHVGFNGSLTDDHGIHNCDVDASLIFTF